MKRLTDEGGNLIRPENDGSPEWENMYNRCVRNAIRSLVAYENTGLTPEEILKLMSIQLNEEELFALKAVLYGFSANKNIDIHWSYMDYKLGNRKEIVGYKNQPMFKNRAISVIDKVIEKYEAEFKWGLDAQRNRLNIDKDDSYSYMYVQFIDNSNQAIVFILDKFVGLFKVVFDTNNREKWTIFKSKDIEDLIKENAELRAENKRLQAELKKYDYYRRIYDRTGS